MYFDADTGRVVDFDDVVANVWTWASTDKHDRRAFTVADDRWAGPRRREILRAREEFCRLFFDDDVPKNSAAGLRRYFLAFAVAARSR